jgi:cyclohexadienyl dehydratase
VNRRAPAAALLLFALACARHAPRDDRPPLRVGTSGDYAPFSVASADGFTGLDVEIAHRFAEDTGRRLELVAFRWDDLTRDLAAGHFDVAMGGVTMRPERAVRGTFTRPVVETGAVVLAGPDLEPFDRPEVHLAVNAGGHLERVARRLFPHATLVLARDNRSLPDLVRAGAADALLTDDAEATGFAAALPGTVRSGPLTRDRKAYLARDPELARQLDLWLRARETDGTLAMLRARWLDAERAARTTSSGSDLGALLALVDLRLALMPAVAAAKEAAGRPVLDAEQEARVLAAVETQARARGVAPAGIASLFIAQLTAARKVQRSFLALPVGGRPEVEALDLEHELRPTLSALSAAIVDRAADLSADPTALSGVNPTALAERLDASVAPLGARLAIAKAITALREPSATIPDRLSTFGTVGLASAGGVALWPSDADPYPGPSHNPGARDLRPGRGRVSQWRVPTH